MEEKSTDLKINDLQHEVGELKHRVSICEEWTKKITDMTISVKELAINMKNMYDEQVRQGKRLDDLEKEPGETAKYLKRTVLSSIVTGVIGALLGAALALILK